MTATDGRQRYARVRSVLEVPISNEKYWSKVPEVAADAIMLDLEDSVTPSNKESARAAVVEALRDQAYFGGRTVIVRCNNIASEWGRLDIEALAAADSDFLVSYPKVESAEELAEVQTVMAAVGRPRGLHVMIETARALIELDRIASAPGVEGLHFGYVDFAADVGSRPFDDAELFGPVNHYARAKIAIAAAAYKLFATGGTLIPEYKDLDKVRAFVKVWRDVGYTGVIAVSPSHLPIVNEVMAPSPTEVDRARRVSEAYEDALERSEPAAVLDGRVITMPDYRVAQLTLARAT